MRRAPRRAFRIGRDNNFREGGLFRFRQTESRCAGRVCGAIVRVRRQRGCPDIECREDSGQRSCGRKRVRLNALSAPQRNRECVTCHGCPVPSRSEGVSGDGPHLRRNPVRLGRSPGLRGRSGRSFPAGPSASCLPRSAKGRWRSQSRSMQSAEITRSQWRDRAGFPPASLLGPKSGTQKRGGP